LAFLVLLVLHRLHIKCQPVDITIHPILTRLEGFDQRVAGGVEVLGGVFVL